MFKGIPLAEAPVKDLRWKPPVPKQPWNETLIAPERTRECPQIWGSKTAYEKHELDGRVGEDCLLLDIWRPLKGNVFLIHVFSNQKSRLKSFKQPKISINIYTLY